MNKHFFLGFSAIVLSTSTLASQLGDQVGAMSESGRRKFIGMLIKQSGAPCPTVRRTFFQGRLDGKDAVWNASCDARSNFGIVFQDDAANSTRVVKCTELKALGATAACFKKF